MSLVIFGRNDVISVFNINTNLEKNMQYSSNVTDMSLCEGIFSFRVDL